MKFASDILVEEHNVILRMLHVLNKASYRLEEGQPVDTDLFLQAVDFIQNFADHCHHSKEENVLFKQMANRGIPVESGPIGMMLMEHDHGRQFTKGLYDAAIRLKNGDESAKEQVVANARNYTQLLTQHIHKENNILYPMGNQVFTHEDQQFLTQEFERVEREETGEHVHEKYLNMVEELEAKFNIVDQKVHAM